MLANIRFWEERAKAGRYAIPHFIVWNAEMLMGVMDAAEELKAPVIISFGTGFVGNTVFEDFCWMMKSMAEKAAVPVITHWDHGRSMEIIQNAYNHGMNSVMRDASALPFEENIKEIQAAVDYFHPLGVPVEAELGHVGNETVYEEALAAYAYTDPSHAAEFVERTGCDSLAIAIGTSHGAYKFKPGTDPKLRLDILEEVEKRLPEFPIVLHGSSSVPQEFVKLINENGGNMPGAIGIPEEQLRLAAQKAVCKINIDSDLRLAMTACIRKYFNEHPDHFDPRQYLGPARDAIREMVKHKIVYVLGCDGKA